MTLPATMSVPRLDPGAVAQVRKLCDAIVESARIGLDSTFLVDSLNETTANEFSCAEVVRAAAAIGTEALACLAISPPTPRVEATAADWATLIERIRGAPPGGFDRAWWLELVAHASDRDDAAARVLATDDGDTNALATELFGG